MADQAACVICGHPARRRRRCPACFAYLLRNGHDRPTNLLVLHERRLDQQRFEQQTG